MSKKSGDSGGIPAYGVGAVNMTIGEVVVVAGFSGGVPVLTSLPISQVTDPPVGPESAPSETNILQWPLQEADTDVPLSTVPTTVVVGSVFRIDQEYMTVTDVSNIDNPAVTRATYGSVLAAHNQGQTVTIWGQP